MNDLNAIYCGLTPIQKSDIQNNELILFHDMYSNCVKHVLLLIYLFVKLNFNHQLPLANTMSTLHSFFFLFQILSRAIFFTMKCDFFLFICVHFFWVEPKVLSIPKFQSKIVLGWYIWETIFSQQLFQMGKNLRKLFLKTIHYTEHFNENNSNIIYSNSKKSSVLVVCKICHDMFKLLNPILSDECLKQENILQNNLVLVLLHRKNQFIENSITFMFTRYDHLLCSYMQSNTPVENNKYFQNTNK